MIYVCLSASQILTELDLSRVKEMVKVAGNTVEVYKTIAGIPGKRVPIYKAGKWLDE